MVNLLKNLTSKCYIYSNKSFDTKWDFDPTWYPPNTNLNEPKQTNLPLKGRICTLKVPNPLSSSIAHIVIWMETLWWWHWGELLKAQNPSKYYYPYKTEFLLQQSGSPNNAWYPWSFIDNRWNSIGWQTCCRFVLWFAPFLISAIPEKLLISNF